MSTVKPTLGTRVNVPDIENELKTIWRKTVDAEDEIPITKAATVNLVMLVRDEEHFAQIAQEISVLLEHHPGRFILIFVNKETQDESITAHVAFFCQYFNKTQSKTCCDLISIQTGALAESLLPGIIVPLLMPDLPVVLWCTDSCEVIQDKQNLLKYTDRIIAGGLQENASFEEMTTRFKEILYLNEKNAISDLKWSNLSAWREAIAQLFDNPANRALLKHIDNIAMHTPEIHADATLYLPAWLSSQLGWTFEKSDYSAKYIKMFFQDKERSIPFHIHQDDEHMIVITIKNQDCEVLIKIIEKQNVLKSIIEKNGKPKTVNYINMNQLALLEKMCNELDYQEIDPVYTSVLTQIDEMLSE